MIKKYARKFTPRKIGSIWSKSNIDRVEKLIKDGKMTKYGLRLFKERNNECLIRREIQSRRTAFSTRIFQSDQEEQSGMAELSEVSAQSQERLPDVDN